MRAVPPLHPPICAWNLTHLCISWSWLVSAKKLQKSWCFSFFSCSCQDVSCQFWFLAEGPLTSSKSMKTPSYCTWCSSWAKSGKIKTSAHALIPLYGLKRYMDSKADTCDVQKDYSSICFWQDFEVALSAPNWCRRGQQVPVVSIIQTD